MAHAWGLARSMRRSAACSLALWMIWLLAGCGPPVAPPEPDAKVHLKKLMELYKLYVERKQQGPPNADALKEFGKSLTPEDRDVRMIGEDVEGIFTSPRDGQPYVITYNLKLDPSTNKAFAWETTGKDGKRFVALTMGYVEEYDEQMFQEAKR